ncbi:hypothetical protein [Xenorhabdus miraniensis]|uniref:Lipoprotein n=1 Tax=Xenorhabdus miraniensis TaxID=351674 RepID=A0A2D0JTV7_9GAMM|nr:hypothetical protein [Xenorhabdus miraniensis]PHM49769.1 hypothetical protein Xmir_01222 [Xenorhabdus miraniensis]
MKKLIILLAGTALLSGCSIVADIMKLKEEKRSATTISQKFNFLIHVSEEINHKPNGVRNPEPFKSIRNQYIKEVSLTKESDDFKEELVKNCFWNDDTFGEASKCTYEFYRNKINIEQAASKATREVKNRATRLHQIRMEDAHNIAKTVIEEGGAEFTEVNIGRFCRASSRVVATAYASVVNTYHIYDLEADKIMLLGLTDKAFVRLKKKVTSDKRGIAMVRNNYRDQEIVYEAYDVLCHANPKAYILNYKKIFR